MNTDGSIPHETQSVAPVMWRSYQIGFNTKDQLTLVGAFKREWTQVELTGYCYIKDPTNTLSDRYHHGGFFRPGEYEAARGQSPQARAYVACRAHLMSGACSCGVWGYKSPIRVQHEYAVNRFWTGFSAYDAVYVICAVRIFGVILEGDLGYRASDAQIEAMFVPADKSELYIGIDPLTKRFAYLQDGRFALISDTPTLILNSGYEARAISTERLWAKLAQQFDCQVIPVPSGTAIMQQWAREFPDPYGLQPLVND